MYWTYPFCENPNKDDPFNMDVLEKYMLHNDTKQAVLEKMSNIGMEEEDTESPPLENEEILSISDEKKETVHDLCRKRLYYAAKCEDPLFWSIYVAVNGYTEYRRVGKHNGKLEMSIKKEITDRAYSLGSKYFKLHLQTKMTKAGLSRMIETILTHPRTPLDTLYLYCMFYSINIVIVDLQKHTYLSYSHQDAGSQRTVVLYKTDTKSRMYFIDTEQQLYTTEYISMNYLYLLSNDKPLKAASSYKVSDLEMMAATLELPLMKSEGQKWKKQELYDMIALHCVWNA